MQKSHVLLYHSTVFSFGLTKVKIQFPTIASGHIKRTGNASRSVKNLILLMNQRPKIKEKMTKNGQSKNGHGSKVDENEHEMKKLNG